MRFFTGLAGRTMVGSRRWRAAVATDLVTTRMGARRALSCFVARGASDTGAAVVATALVLPHWISGAVRLS